MWRTEEDGWVCAKWYCDERGAKVHEGFYRMHVGAGECGRVVRLVVQGVNVPLK